MRARPPAPAGPDEGVVWPDLRPVLDEEARCLPEKYRTPFVLCCVQGETYEEAARRLGCPVGTVATRLSRARERLRGRLTRRGLSPSAVPPGAAWAAVPAALAVSVGKDVVTGADSTRAAAPAQGVIQAMLVTRLGRAAAAALRLALVAAGAGALVLGGLAVAAPRTAGPADDKRAEAELTRRISNRPPPPKGATTLP